MAVAVANQLTYEDYLALPDDGKRYQILEGELFVSPAPSTRHQRLLGRLHLEIGTFLLEKPLGEVLLAPCDVLLDEKDIVQPDLIYVARDHAEQVEERYVAGAPDLVVEILSPSTRRLDEVLKRRRYAHFGIGEYWIVDAEIDVVKVYRRAGDALPRVAELALEEGDRLTTPLLPGFELPLARLFAR